MTFRIEINRIHPHPQNPRVVLRQDVIDAIASNLAGGFDEAYALIVRPVGDHYQIISGHHRIEAAKKAGIEAVPCWVREYTDEEAYMALATSNSQGELSPLEIGIHALHYVPTETGGRGKKGGLSAYAARVGKQRQNISDYRSAAEVFEAVKPAHQYAGLQDKAKHLATIHALPEPCWSEAVAIMVDKGWSAKDTAERVKTAKQATTNKQILALFAGKTTERELARIYGLFEQVHDHLEDDDLREKWVAWFDEADPIDVKEIQSKRIEFEDIQAERKAREEEKEKSDLPQLVLADPPWRYDFAQSDSRQIENQYPSATVDEIIGHRPETNPDCVLLLWATVAKLKEAIEVLEGWGFEYKTHAVWDKEKIGMGYWFRGQHELLLVGTKGKASPPDESNRVSSVFRETRGQHSEKPRCVYEWVDRAFPTLKKLEMYCRNPRPGWLVFGNESEVKNVA